MSYLYLCMLGGVLCLNILNIELCFFYSTALSDLDFVLSILSVKLFSDVDSLLIMYFFVSLTKFILFKLTQ